MATFQGNTFSGYESIAPYRSYLDLSMDDIDFSSNVRNPLMYSEKSSEKCGNEYTVIKDFQPRMDSSTYGFLRRLPNTQKFLNFVENYDLFRYMKDDFTLFIPVNPIAKDGSVGELSTILNTIRFTPLNALDILNFHKLNYIIEPVELFNRKLKLQSNLKNQYILTDDTSIGNGKSLQIVTDTSTDNPNKILQSIKTDNGYIYLIERPLIPYVY